MAALLVSLGDSLVKADIDWRTKGVVTNMKDQGGSFCNLSWAFAITGVVEGATAVQTGMRHTLSEQELVD